MNQVANQEGQAGAFRGKAVAAALLAIMALGLLLRTWRLAEESAWWDEVASLQWLGASNLGEFLRLDRLTDPVMPPAYFVVEYYWSKIAGPSVLGMRLLSVAAGMAAIPMMYVLGRRLYGSRAGLIAAAAQAIAMVQVYYSQEIRAYAFIPLLTLVSVYALLQALSSRRSVWWGLHVAINAVLAFTHLFAVLLIVAEGCFLLLFRWREKRLVAAWTSAHAALAVSLGTWILSVDMAHAGRATSWIVPPGLREVGMMFLVFAGGRASNENPAQHLPTGVSLDWLLAALVGILIAQFVARAVRPTTPRTAQSAAHARWPRNEALTLLLLWLVVPPVALGVTSYLWQPCFVYRYGLCSSLPLYLLLGAAISSLGSAKSRTVACLALGLLFAYQWTTLAVGPFRPDWISVSRALEAQTRPDDEILVFQDINLAALEFNSSLPKDRLHTVSVWSAVCDPVIEAHQAGRDTWLVIWLWSDPIQIENCFRANDTPFTWTDYRGWPNLRVYHVLRKEASG